MRPVKDDLTHDDAVRDLADVLGDYVWTSERDPESCRDRLAAYIENTETERDNYFEAMNAGLVRCRQLIKERDFLETNLAACHSNFTAAVERRDRMRDAESDMCGDDEL
jgi:hypothetical protein